MRADNFSLFIVKNVFFFSQIYPEKRSEKRHVFHINNSMLELHFNFSTAYLSHVKPHDVNVLLGGAEHPKPNRSYKGQIQIMQEIFVNFTRFETRPRYCYERDRPYLSRRGC